MSTSITMRGRSEQKRRTRRRILEASTALIASGLQPTVTEAADAAGVSRRTAYRYFPSQIKLLSEAALEGVRPIMEAAIDAAPAGNSDLDAETRVIALVNAMQNLTIEYELLLRTMIHATVLEPIRGHQVRGTRRVEWIELAVAPLRSRLKAAAFKRLVSGLTLCVGIEAVVVFRDIRGMTGQQSISASKWMARSLLRATLDEARGKS